MKIPADVKAAVKAAETKRKQELYQRSILPWRPECWATLGKLSENHPHDADGKCILKNHSRDEVHKSPTGGVWIRRTK